ncbi:MAG: hypothetical protein DI589_02245 [Shinella sp.]|nr:MAG: hypothetical protein DI589_02245 [Shinella sp.]
MDELHAPLTDNDRVRYHEEKLVQIAQRIYEMEKEGQGRLWQNENGQLVAEDAGRMLRIEYEVRKMHTRCLTLARSYLTASAA